MFFLSFALVAAEQWQWENPTPSGNKLSSIWGTSQNNLYSVGAQGTLVRYNGISWASIESGTKDSLNSVWGSDSNNIFAVGGHPSGSVGSTVLHFDGASWNEINIGSTQRLHAVWGMSANDIYIAGFNGKAFHYDGVQWLAMSTGTTKHLHSIWASNTNDVFMVGDSGTIRHFNGSFWAGMSVPSSALSYDLEGIWGSASDNIYAVGGKYENNAYHSIILHYNGTTWTEVLNQTGYSLNSIHGSSAGKIFASANASPASSTVVLHFDGSTWNVIPAGLDRTTLYSTWTDSSDTTYFVGTIGEILQYSNSTFTSMRTGTGKHLTGTWCGQNNNITSVGQSGTIINYDGSSWSTMPSGTSSSLNAVWGNANNDLFTVSSLGEILHYDGTNWSPMSSGTSLALLSVWGNAANDVFVGGDGVILHYNGSTWSPMLLPFVGSQLDYIGIWGSSSSNVYAVSKSGSILHYDGGSQWLELTTTFPITVTGISGTSATDIMVSSSNGTITHFDGVSWTVSATNVSWANSIIGSAPNEYYTAGSFGKVFHYDGTNWSDISPSTTQSLYDVCVASDNTVHVIGNNGSVLNYGQVDNVPQVSILSPDNAAVVQEDEGAISFSASASDVEDGDLTTSVQWSSSIDGAFTSPAVLSVGTHTITASVNDSMGQTGSAIITLTVEAIVNLPPTAVITSNDTTFANTPIIFDASLSVDPNGDTLFYDWDFGDETFGFGVNVSHTYTAPGPYTVTLRVSDGINLPTETTKMITLLVLDSDNDGLSDDFEIINGLDPLDNGSIDINNGPDGDLDGDGFTNLEEQAAGSDASASGATSNPGIFNFSTNAISINEDAGIGSINVTRTGGAIGAVSVLCFSTDIDASSITDYSEVNTTLNWDDNDATDKVCSFSITPDSDVEGNETFQLDLSSPGGGAKLGAP